ncbi:MAG: hypothetical protein WA463_18825 [Terriglobales bacterium]
MKKLLIILGLLVLAPGALLAQGPTYYVDYYANNPGPVTSGNDQVIRIVNVGRGGTPLTSPVGDICADIYVFDNNQEMISCCSCRLTPNELLSASVAFNLTNNPVTSVVPAAGVVKIGLTGGFPACDTPLTASDASLGVVFGTHLQVTGGATFVTEAEKLPSPLSAAEAAFLPTACQFAQYLGSGKGICSCRVPGN